MTGLPPPRTPAGPAGGPEQPDDPQDPQRRGPGPGALRPTTGAVLAPWAGVGLVGGWLARPVAADVLGAAPSVLWRQVLVLALLAAALGTVARVTHRALQVRRERLEPHRAVNRLLLARASALAGALAAGGYTGYAVSWLGLPSERASEETVRALAAAGAGVALVACALLLERACRVRSDDTDA